MELDQKSAFPSKSSKFVATLPDQDFPDTVLLFEARISHPALRVTRIQNYFKISNFFDFRLEFSMKFTKKQIFSLFSFLLKNARSVFRNFDLDIIYRRARDLGQQIKHTSNPPKMNSNQNLNGWSSIKN